MNANGKKLESGQGTDNAVRGLATLQNLFPTKISFVIFVAYMALFINQGKPKMIHNDETIVVKSV